MVLETLYETLSSEKHPLTLALMAFIVSGAAMAIAYNNFPESASALTTIFIMVGFMPIAHKLFVSEEEKVVKEPNVPFAFISAHSHIIHAYGWIFVGLVLSFGIFTIILPETNKDCADITCMIPTKNAIFSEQKKVYTSITGKVPLEGEISANVVGAGTCFGEGRAFDRCFGMIFENNFSVMGRAIIFSFLWGAGAIELLAWNASVIGYFIGSEIIEKSIDAGISRAVGYLPHGIPEVLAYFIAAIAGGIINVMVSKNKFKHHEISMVLTDVILLTALATIILLIGALIETASIFSQWLVAIGGITAFFALAIVLYVPSLREGLKNIGNDSQGQQQ